jgi:CubicO group peptidase (beta-lactamase class C family)
MLALLACASAGGSMAHPAAYDKSALDKNYRGFLDSEAKKIQGLSIALVDYEGQDSFFSFGKAGNGRKVDEDSVFNVGSISKLFVSVAVMKLVEQGKMDLDAPVNRYIPEFTLASPSGSSAAITIRSLLTHESGLVSDIMEGWYLEAPGGKAGTTGKDYRRIVEQLNRTKTTREPWTEHSYSNAGFSLLGVAVERASGQDYAEFVGKEILKPWGMTESGFAYDGLDPKNIVQGFERRSFKNKEKPVPYIRDLPAGLFCSSARDMARFIRGLLGDQAGERKVLQPGSVAELWRVQNGDVKLDRGIMVGLAFMRRPIASLGLENIEWHDGSLPPFHALLFLDPLLRIGGFAVANSEAGDLDSLLTQGLRHQIILKTQRDPERAPEAAISPEPSMGPEQEKEMCGVYQLPSGIFRIYQRGDDMLIETPAAVFEIVAHQDSSFGLRPLLFGFIPKKEQKDVRLRMLDIDGSPVLSMQFRDYVLDAGKKLEPTLLSPAWKKRLGPWMQAGTIPMSLGGNASYVLSYDYTTRILSVGGAIAIKPIDDNEAIIDGYGRNTGESIEAGQDAKGPWLRYSGMELRQIPR